MTLHDVHDTSLIRDLRRQLDAALGRHGELERRLGIANARIQELEQVAVQLNTERDNLRARLMGEAEEGTAENQPAELKGSAWWMAACRESNRLRVELTMRVTQVETWLREHGQELASMQARNVILQRIVDTVRAHDPDDVIGTVKVHHPDGGPSAWLFDAIDSLSTK